MASTTKIMTCILVLESGRQEETARTSAYAASMPEVHMGAKEGESYKVRDLLYGLMLESYNDAAVILAEHVGGSTQAFAEMMNEKAREIGCENTWFITPNGLDSQEETPEGMRIHSTTAEDLARILRYCIRDSANREEFLEITRTPSYTFTDTAGTKMISCTNHNAFLSMMEGALTGKTGFTADAGYCYVGALEREGKTLIVALLGCGWPNNKNYKWADARKLMEYGLEYYTWQSFAQTEIPEIPRSLPVENGSRRCWDCRLRRRCHWRKFHRKKVCFCAAMKKWKRFLRYRKNWKHRYKRERRQEKSCIRFMGKPGRAERFIQSKQWRR